MTREARALGVSLALHGALLAGVLSVCGGAPPGPAKDVRVIDLRLLEPGIARAAAPRVPGPAAAPPPQASRPATAAAAPAAPPVPVPAPIPVPVPAPDPVALAPERLPEPAAAQTAPVEDPDAAPAVAPVAGAEASPDAATPGERRAGPATADAAPATDLPRATAAMPPAATGSGAAGPEATVAGLAGDPAEGGGGVPRDLALLREIVQRGLVYPSLARRMGWEGRVTLSFIVCRDGSAREVAVMESSGREMLDRHAVESVQKLSGLPASTTEAKVIIPVVYRLH